MESESPQTTLIRQLEERLLKPEVRKSARDVADLLADELIEFGSSGGVYNKQQTIEGLQQESRSRWSLRDFKTSVLAPDVVLATYRAARHGPSGERSVDSLRSSIWKLIGGRWQMVFHQGTSARESYPNMT